MTRHSGCSQRLLHLSAYSTSIAGTLSIPNQPVVHNFAMGLALRVRCCILRLVTTIEAGSATSRASECWCCDVEEVSVQDELPPALWYGVTSEDCAHQLLAVRKVVGPRSVVDDAECRWSDSRVEAAAAVGPLPGVQEVLRADGLGLD